MKDISSRIFRRMPGAVATRADGSTVEGRGTVVRLKDESGGHVDGEGHEMGKLCQPLFVFTGWLGEVSPGDVLEQDGVRYTVLKAGPMAVGGTRVGLRAVMERQVADDGGA